MRYLLLTLVLIFMGCSEGYLQNDQLIVGGEVLPYSDKVADYIVNIYSADFIGYNRVCTGVFVAQNAILTAKHCNENAVAVTFRNSNYAKTGEVANLTVVYSKPVDVPPNVRDDLVILYFEEKLPAQAKIAELASFEKLLPSTKVYVAGYGLSNTDKNNLKTSLIYDEKPRFKEISLAHIIDQQGHFLIDQKQAKGGVCEGDSGGPAYFLEPTTKRMQVIGIASAVGSNCEDKSYFIKTDFPNLKQIQEVN